MPKWTSELAWLPAGASNNPFPFKTLDCRAASMALAQAMTETVAANSFSSIEQIVRSQPTPPPTDCLSAPCCFRIRLREPLSALSSLASMESGHKWLFAVAGKTLVVRRRWTGQTVHVAEFNLADADMTVVHLTSQRDSVYNTIDYAVAELEFLLKTYLEGTQAAFPIPPGLGPADSVKIALSGWKAHGPVARYGRMINEGL